MKALSFVSALVLVSGSASGQCDASKTAASDCNATSGWVADSMTVAYSEPTKNIVETAVEAGSFGTLVAAVQAAGLADALSGEGPFTVFAPTDEAFAALPEGTVESLLKPENREMLRTILLYHVVSGDVRAAQVVDLDVASTLSGQRVAFSSSAEGVKVDNANVVSTDILTTNGTIHVIDRVIMPSTKNIIETAVEAGSFSTLAAAIKAAGLAEALKGEGPFTVFAPTDEAFAALPEGTVESLLKPENRSKLQDILKYHVVAGRVYADDAIKAGSAKTLQGDSVTITSDQDAAMIDNARILSTDIDTTNGVIHAIDSVLMHH